MLVDQYLSFAEFQAKQRRPMHMSDWVRKLDEFLKLNERDILMTAGNISAKLGEEIAEREYDKYWVQQRSVDQANMSDFDHYVRRVESERSRPR